MVLEICVDSLESARAAESGGAQRVELCSALSEGGVTPSAGLISGVRESLTIPIFVMVRPRAGDFYYSPDEFALMQKDIVAARAYGADGVVLGVLLKNGQIDVERTRDLADLARPMGVTFHRAIDWTPSLEDAIDHVIAAGADRILTSGGKQTAAQGSENLARLVSKANDRIRVMVCGRIRKDNVAEIARKTNAKEFHASLRKKIKSPVTYQNSGLTLGEAGLDEFARYAVAADDVRALREAMEVTPDGGLLKESPSRR
jgi:copper homeostasis protein